MTLKQGVQNLLCHYIPEVKEVIQFNMIKKLNYKHNLNFSKFLNKKT